METWFEQTLGLDRAERVARVLEIQAEAYGYLDLPILSRELSRFSGGSVLDIGTGDGSFLFKVAAENPALNFLGIEQSPEFLARAKSRLRKMELPNVQLTQAVFGSGYQGKHNVILARFTLQHTRQPQEFLQNAHRALKPDGCFVCVEPVYDYYDCAPPQKIWQEFRAKMLATYARWGSHPNIPKQVCRWLANAGFGSIRATISLYSPATIGRDRFAAVVLATAAMLNHQHPDLWETTFLEELEGWTQKPDNDPFITIAHIIAKKFNFTQKNT